MAARRRSHNDDAHDAPDDRGISDSVLLQRHLDGDAMAFAALIERYRQELYAFLARFCGDRQLAEDIFQETFLQLHISGESFDMSRRLKPWLYTIAANKARDALRKRTRRQMAPLDAPAGNHDDAGTFAELIPTDIPPPSETMANLELRQAVQSIVETLPDNLRQVLVLAYFSEMSYKEVAEATGAPLGTIKSRLHTAVRAFAEKWKTTARRLGYEQRGQ
ncbi:MAG: RNA polymerase sigma factor [Planctomycetota bacterium]|jgi:RNA polymerase sigma-70 factor (ECF subfamily)